MVLCLQEAGPGDSMAISVSKFLCMQKAVIRGRYQNVLLFGFTISLDVAQLQSV